MRTLTDIAQAAGITKRELDRLIARGALDSSFFVRRGEKGAWRGVPDERAAEVVAAIREHLDIPDDGVIYNIDQARAMKEHFAALREQLRYRHECGELYARDEVERAIVDAVTILRERLGQMPSQLGGEVAHIDDPFEIETLIAHTVALAMTEFVVRIGDEIIADASE